MNVDEDKAKKDRIDRIAKALEKVPIRMYKVDHEKLVEDVEILCGCIVHIHLRKMIGQVGEEIVLYDFSIIDHCRFHGEMMTLISKDWDKDDYEDMDLEGDVQEY